MRGSFFFLALAIASISQANTVTFSDGTFNPDDWTVTIKGNGTASWSQSATGGNPGAFREITNNVDGIAMWGYHLNNSAVYNPSVQGAILSIDYAEDGIVLAGSGNLGAGPALMQGGKVYGRGFGSVGSTAWTLRTLSDIHEDSFVHWHGEPGGVFPNFSATGGPITFGFWRGNAEGTYSMTTGMDNWSMTLHTANPVPEPAALGVAALSAIALLRRRVR